MLILNLPGRRSNPRLCSKRFVFFQREIRPFFPVYERAVPAIGSFRCLRRLRILPPPIAGMVRSYTNIGAVPPE